MYGKPAIIHGKINLSNTNMKTKARFLIYSLFIFGVLLFFNIGCKKDQTENNTVQIEKGTITDIDGNVYVTVKIGTQWWMAENLKTTRYNDGSSISLVLEDSIWGILSTPGYCFFNNDYKNKEIYGALYNWYAVNTNKLAPSGWHVPTSSEWMTLFNYVGGADVAGDKLKESGKSHWQDTNSGITNDYGFNALPGGQRGNNESFFWYLNTHGFWWSSAQANNGWAGSVQLTTGCPWVDVYELDPHNGFSVRCVRD
jgi:uncharacterized protein (TIGR02145 family)